MPFVSTSQDSFGPGMMALQHENWQGGGWSLDARASIWVTRVMDRRDGAKQVGHWRHAEDSKGRGVVADLTGIVFWEQDTRDMAGSTWVFPSRVVAQTAGASFGVGVEYVLPKFDVANNDPRYAALKLNVPPEWNRPPIGWQGLVVSGTDENKQRELWHPADPRLIAANRGVNGAGDRVYGQRVVDVTGSNACDTTRWGPLGSILRVSHVDGAYQPAINGGWPAFFPVWTAATTTPIVAKVMVDRGGPFTPGASNDPHMIRLNRDGEREQPMALACGENTGALWYSKPGFNAPLEMLDAPYPKVRRAPSAFVPGYIVYDDKDSHTNNGRVQKGMRKIVVESPWQTPVIDPPVKLPPVNDQPDGGGGGGGWWWLPWWPWWPWGGPPGQNPNPQPDPEGEDADLLKTPHETAAPSFHGMDHTGPRFGGRAGGSPAGGIGDSGSPGRDTGIEDPELAGRGDGESADEQVGEPYDPYAGDSSGLAGARSAENGNEEPTGDADGPSDVPTGSGIGFGMGTRQGLGPPLDSSDPPKWITQPETSVAPRLPIWEETSAVAWSLQTISSRSADNASNATFRPNRFFKNSATAPGVAWFTAPEIIWNARRPPSRFSQVTLAFFNGVWPDATTSPTASVNIGKPAIVGFLSPKKTTGGGVNGWYFTATGNSGTVNAETRFLDADGAARVGVTSHYGTFRVTDGSEGTPSISFHDDTDVGLYRGGANQLNFTTGGTLRARINTAALAPAGSGTTCGALSDPWAELYATTATISTLTVSAISTVPTWIKYTKTYTQLAAAATTNDIELLSLAAGGIIHAVKIKHSASFTGGAIAAYTVSVGIAGTLNKYANAFDIFQATGNTVQQLSTTVGTENHAAATSIRLAATSTGANLDAATAGSVDVWVLQSKAV